MKDGRVVQSAPHKRTSLGDSLIHAAGEIRYDSHCPLRVDVSTGFRRRTKQTNLAKVQPSCFRRLLRFRDGLQWPDSTILSATTFGLRGTA